MAHATTPVRWFCLQASTVADVDFSGSFVLRGLTQELAGRGVTFVLTNVPEPVMKDMRRDGLVDVIGADHIFPGPRELFAAYDRLPPAAAIRAEETPPH